MTATPGLQWHDIETAPRNGDHILLARSTFEGTWRIGMGHWVKPFFGVLGQPRWFHVESGRPFWDPTHWAYVNPPEKSAMTTTQAPEVLTDERLREILADLPGDGRGDGYVMAVAAEIRSAITEILSLRTTGEAVAVKPLEWNERGFAHSPVGIFFHLYPEDDKFRLERREGYTITHSVWPDEASAKAFAQSKYEEVVRSALVGGAA